MVGYGWFGFMAPSGTPGPMIDRMNAEVNAILKLPKVGRRITDLGLEVQGGSPAEFSAHIVRESRKWSEVIRVAGIRGE